VAGQLHLLSFTQELRVPQRLLEDFQADPHTNKGDVEARLMCYQLDIGIGSIAYNAFKKDWKNAEEAADYTLNLLSGSTDYRG